MRILIVVHGFPPHAQGGSEIYAEASATALERAGDTVLVLTREADRTRPEYAVRESTRDGVRVAWVNNTFREVTSFEESYTQPRIADIAARVIADFAPDVAHVHHLTCLSTLIPARLARAGVPCIMTLHDHWLLCHRGQLLDRDLQVCRSAGACANCIEPAALSSTLGHGAALLRQVESLVPARASRLLRRVGASVGESTQSEDDCAEAARRRLAHMREATRSVERFFAPSVALLERHAAAGFERERITHVPYGFDASSWAAPAPVRRAAPLRLGFVGSLMVSKAPHVLLEAAAQLPAGSVSVELFGSHVPYHGDDSYRARLAPLLTHPTVTTHGTVSHEKVPDAFASIDVLVVPSVWPENSPLVIHEAFLAGVPVVASNIGGIRELVRDGENGLLFSPGDSQSLSAALNRLLTEPALLPSLRARRTPVRALDDETTWMRAAYNAAVDRRRRAAIAPRVHAVVLNYRAPAATRRAVESLLASTHALASITVIDNSDDVECGRALRDLSEQIDYLSNDTNLGFSGGMNVGIRRALLNGATHLLLVNSDIVVSSDCIQRVLDALQTEAAGIAGPTVCSLSAPDRIESVGLSYHARTGRMTLRGHGLPVSAVASLRGRVDAVAGCLMLIDRRVFETVGLLDESYFFGFEDLDFCLHASRHGFDTITTDGLAYHEGGASLAPTSPDRFYYAARNHLRLADAHGSGSAAMRAARRQMVVALNAAHAVRSGPRQAQSRLKAVMRGVRDYKAGRFGPVR